ncbi:hypothetical protein ASPCAL00067 [Aspergillus calidoustus]|uniref:Uncharacterized protein n=1 Tax=Aspergillus calidoustus TaxID=454130 RepID=A0A0U5FMG4_ASPCI|nr:hypothetical protein ASPCAL00067 [Aspergillus calidoustus]
MPRQETYCDTEDRKVQRWIEAKIRHDPEADPPTLGVPEMHAFHDSIHEWMMTYGELKRLFGIKTSEVQVIRSYGESPHAKELETMIKQRTETYDRQFRRVEYEQLDRMWDDLQNQVLCTILKRCIKARKKALGCSGRARKPILRPTYVKGQQMVLPYRDKHTALPKDQEYFLADSTYAIGFKDSTGRVRDYFIILWERVINKRLPLILYMAITHLRLKREGRNAVVYGLHTDMSTFVFLKIDRNSELIENLGELDLLYGFSGRVREPRDRCWDVTTKTMRPPWSGLDELVTQIDNILETADEDCYGVRGPASVWSDQCNKFWPR